MEYITKDLSVEINNRLEGLVDCEKCPDELWEDVTNIVKEAANKRLIKRKRLKRAKWLSKETMNIAEKRRIAKGEGNHDRIKELKASFQREARRDKETFYNDQCNMIEESSSKGKTRNLFKTIRDITGTFKPRIGIVKNKQGKDLSEGDAVKARWKEHTEDLYRRDTIGHY